MAPTSGPAFTLRPRAGVLILSLALALSLAGPCGLAAQAAGSSGSGGSPAATAAAAPGALGSLRSPARLLSGPAALRGLPFFAPNAIRVLRGEYDLGPFRVAVWYTREALVFGEAWKVQPSGRGGAARAWLLERAGGPVLAIVEQGYSLFVELPLDSASMRRFAWAWDEKFRVFFLNAPTDAELSFPAFVDFVP